MAVGLLNRERRQKWDPSAYPCCGRAQHDKAETDEPEQEDHAHPGPAEQDDGDAKHREPADGHAGAHLKPSAKGQQDGEPREGGRRESRRERWERRREERNRRFEGESEGSGEVREEQPAFEAPEPAAESRPEPRSERAPRRPRRDEDEAPAALPGFLTRSAAPAASEPAEAAPEAPAAKRRAPRRKAEAPADEG